MKKLLFHAVLLMLTLSLYSQEIPSWVPQNGLAAYWPMSGSGNDASGNGNHGVVHGATPVPDRFGTTNSAYGFDGNAYIDVKDTASLNPTAALTLSMWVQTTTGHGVAGVLGKWNNYGGIVGVNKEQFCFDVSDTHYGINFQVKTTDNFKVNPHEDTILYKNGNWNHYVGTYDGSYAKLYVNGKLVSTYRTSGPVQVFRQNFEIGRIAGGQPTCATAFYFTGNIDDVGLWNRALTPREVSALYSGCPGFEATIAASGPLSFCQGGEVTLNATPIEGASVTWFRNDTLIAGASGSSYTARQSGKYFVTLANGECSSTSPQVTVDVQAPPRVVINASGPTSFCQGQSVVLTASGGNSYLWNTGATSGKITVREPGTYSVQASSGSCSSEDSVAVNVFPLPEVTIVTPDPFVDFNHHPVLLSGQPSGGTFSGKGISAGLFDPAKAGLGKSTVTYTFTSPHGCLASASREVVVFDTTGVVCTTFDTLRVVYNDTITVTRFDTITVTQIDTLVLTSHLVVPDTLVVVSTMTSTHTNTTQNLLKIYPNPAKTHLTLELTGYARQKNYSVTIRNSLGQTVFLAETLPVTQTIHLAAWSPGLYLLYLHAPDGSEIEIRKVIIQ